VSFRDIIKSGDNQRLQFRSEGEDAPVLRGVYLPLDPDAETGAGTFLILDNGDGTSLNQAANVQALLDVLPVGLALVDQAIDNDSEEQRAQAARGFLAPDWSIDLTLGQMKKLRAGAAAQNTMVDSIVRRTAEKKIAGDWQRRAAEIVDEQIYPALDRQIALMEQLRPTTRPGDGA
jgi:uncharacterized protein (DUF885 family)